MFSIRVILFIFIIINVWHPHVIIDLLIFSLYLLFYIIYYLYF